MINWFGNNVENHNFNVNAAQSAILVKDTGAYELY